MKYFTLYTDSKIHQGYLTKLSTISTGVVAVVYSIYIT